MNLTDSLNSLNQEDVSLNAFRLIDFIQGLPPALQVQALSAVFLLLIDVLELDARRELERAEYIMKGADKRYDYRFNAIRAYIAGEIKNAQT